MRNEERLLSDIDKNWHRTLEVQDMLADDGEDSLSASDLIILINLKLQDLRAGALPLTGNSRIRLLIGKLEEMKIMLNDSPEIVARSIQHILSLQSAQRV